MNLPADMPALFGEMTFSLPIAPVSVQASAQAKAGLTTAISAILEPLEYILTGEVSVEIEWLLHEYERYETDSTPDVDNIVKPILDGLCGPSGILIDDCQVQSVTSYWIDWTRREQQITVRIKYMPDEWLQRRSLIFVQFPKGLCFPLHSDMPTEAQSIFVSAVERSLETRETLQQLGLNYTTASAVLPTHRLFHRTRIHDFPVISVEEHRNRNYAT